MGLTARVGNNVVGAPNIGISCHYATTYWLYHEAHNATPRPVNLVNAAVFMRQLVRASGRRRTKPLGRDLRLVPGSVLIFMDGQNAAHSCIATAAGAVSGYNHNSWFVGANEAAGTFRVHQTANIAWHGRTSRVARRTLHARNYQLFTVTEQAAVDAISDI